jgi:hypothetical protein
MISRQLTDGSTVAQFCARSQRLGNVLFSVNTIWPFVRRQIPLQDTPYDPLYYSTNPYGTKPKLKLGSLGVRRVLPPY